jgi:acyl-CoA thioesterase FadM
VEADFHRVLVFEDEIDVRIWAGHVGETSIEWRFEITRGGDLCVEGTMVVVHVDADGRAAPLPEPLRNRLRDPRA